MTTKSTHVNKPKYNPFNGKLDLYHKSNVMQASRTISRNENALSMVKYAIDNEIHKADTFTDVVMLINTIYNDAVIFECDGTYLLHHVQANTANLSVSPIYNLNDILLLLVREYYGELAIDVDLPKIYTIYKYSRYKATEYELSDMAKFTDVYIKSIPNIGKKGNTYMIDGNCVQQAYLQHILLPYFDIQFNTYIDVLKSRL